MNNKHIPKLVHCVIVSHHDTHQLLAQFIYSDKEQAKVMKKCAQKVFSDEYVYIETYEVK